jgi:hypothetical protein
VTSSDTSDCTALTTATATSGEGLGVPDRELPKDAEAEEDVEEVGDGERAAVTEREPLGVTDGDADAEALDEAVDEAAAVAVAVADAVAVAVAPRKAGIMQANARSSVAGAANRRAAVTYTQSSAVSSLELAHKTEPATRSNTRGHHSNTQEWEFIINTRLMRKA